MPTCLILSEKILKNENLCFYNFTKGEYCS